MTAAMNGSVNVSINDGWIPEFARHGENAFVTPTADHTSMDIESIDNFDHENIMDVLENEVIPTYYDNPSKWVSIMKNSMRDVVPYFDSNRMADEYYQKLYNSSYDPSQRLMAKTEKVEEAN